MIDLKSSQNNIEVVKARQTLIRILISCYIFELNTMIVGNFNSHISDKRVNGILFIIATILFSLNLSVIYRYSSFGIRLFASLRIFLIIMAFIGIIGFLASVLVSDAPSELEMIPSIGIGRQKHTIVQSTLMAACIFILIIAYTVIAVFLFRLAKLIDANRSVTVENV